MWSFSFLLFWGCCGIYTWGMLTLPSLGSMTRHERPRRSSSNVDVNGCVDTTLCPAYATCTNTSTSYYCACKRGFLSSNGLKTFKGPGVECRDIDECSQRPTPCGPNSICRNLPGRYRCSCITGFSSPTGNNWISGKRGRFTCRDVDECANPRSCPEHSTCHNSVGSYSCGCNPGFQSRSGRKSFQGRGEMCEDVDECANPRSCPEHSTCHNSLGNYSCVCNSGYISRSGKKSFQGPGETCQDVDECANPRSCPEHSTCHNSLGNYSCVCNSGYISRSGKKSFQGPGEICQDINECSQRPPLCGPNSICRNLPGRYECSCLTGFSSPTGNNWISGKPGHFACTDVDECANPRSCPEHSTCHNSLGSYSCVCNPGFQSRSGRKSFQGQGEMCEDVDECANPRSCPEHSTCHNSLGNYSCACNPGYISRSGKKNFQGPGETCQDINECSQRPPLCGPNSICRNLPGRYECSCLTGFSSPTGNNWTSGKPGHFACTDVDECANPRSCPEHSTCHNSLGSYSCVCNPGFQSRSGKKSFQGRGEMCEDVDECANPRSCPEHSTCHNSLGNYSCVCNSGYISRGGKKSFQAPGEACQDVDECANPRSCPEHSTCHNSLGNYSCVCNPGYISRSGKKSFQGPGEICQDINECSQRPPLCGPNSICRNLLGRYECSCLTGFSSPTGNNWTSGKPGHFACTDVDECANPRSCPEHSTCHNSLGSYSCVCNPGFQSKSGKKSFQGRGEMCEDVDECANPRSCPEHSTCHNSLGNYSCVCNSGYISRSGKKSFQGAGETCQDIDECSERAPTCGPNSICRNLPGRYECSCLTGFSSPTGNNWIPGKSGHFTCTDVDECANPRSCPEHSTCHNSLGSYSCVCNTGYESRSGKKNFQGPRETCEDVDECSRNSTLCGPNSVCTNIPGKYSCSCLPGFFSPGVWSPEKPEAFKCADVDECLDRCLFNGTCTNTPGSYFCTCHPGFAPSNGQLNSKDQKADCIDIDECLQDPTRCGPNSVCTNTLGSYSCGCIVGFHPNPEGSWKHGNFSCQRGIPFKCKDDVIGNNMQVQLCHVGAAVEPKYVSFCALMNNTLSVLDNVCKNKTTVVSLKNTAKKFASVIENTSKWSNFTKEETSTLATVLLESVQSTTLAAFLKPSANVSQTIQTKHLDIESKVIDKECTKENETFKLKAKGDEMKIWCSTIKESESTGINGVAFVSFVGMESILDERFLQDLQIPWANSKKKLKMNSRIVGGIITGGKKDGFSKPVIYTLENIKPKQDFESAICVSWRPDVEGGRWTPSGCVLLEASKTHTVCGCNRMVNLAVIMASGEVTMEFTLYLISHVGTIISLVCLAVAIITFLLCRTLRNQNTYIHLHLCICLFLAKILFLTGADKTDNQMGCALIAGFLHYLFLACFFWMLVEAVVLFLMVRNLKVVNYFSSRNIKMLYLCTFGYGLPGLVVAVSAGLQPRGYGMYNRCWLNTETGFIWSFLGPVCTIIVVNSILLTWTLCILRQKLSSVNSEVSTLKDTRLLTFKAFAQIFILGCSWVLGIFQIGPVANIMAYLFTIINSLQGAFIFLIHCLLSRQVREEYRRCMARKTKPSSETQTSGIVLSSVPSTSKTVRLCVVCMFWPD
ncbi:adhesion G protein-coupled receptor E1 isoform X1 [Ovis aries]|uniref:adhesion G protein-coupled receptor E1 isoform X1 n=1 Tax=Ovis aries TaxID=9940 RepID=UPI0029526AD9|nr:adhesion G protein-coupled receptor E1 isoform X1 [Ovis aries]